MSADFVPTPAAGDQQYEMHPRRRMLWIPIAAVVLAFALLLGWLPHYRRNKEVNARTQQQRNTLPVVEVQTTQHKFRAGTDLAGHPDTAPECAYLCASLGVFEGQVRRSWGYGTQGAVTGSDLGAGSGCLGRTRDGGCPAKQRQRANGTIHTSAAAGDL
jgi:hypothetical protein